MVEVNDLKRTSKRQWLLALILGFLIGLAIIMPGISGATIAIIFGLYESILFSFGNIFKEFKKCIVFLLPIVIGLAIGFVLGFFVVQGIFEAYPFIVICLFAGLMIGSFPAVKDEIKGVKITKTRIALFVLGIIIPVAIGLISVLFTTSSSDPINPTLPLMLAYFGIGFVVSLTQIIPGLSCSALLMALGQFGAILASVHFDILLNNPLIIVTLLMFGLGFVIGLIVFSKMLNKLFEVKRDSSYTMIVGLSLGSIATMFINPDVFAVYRAWNGAGMILKDVGIGAVLLAIGFVIAYLLVRYQRNHDKKQENSIHETDNKEKEENQ